MKLNKQKIFAVMVGALGVWFVISWTHKIYYNQEHPHGRALSVNPD